MSPDIETIEQALDVASDAILRRARVLEGQDPEVAEMLRTIVTNLAVGLCFDKAERHTSLVRRTIEQVKKVRAA